MALVISVDQEKLIKIHETAGRTSDVVKLQEVADEMFPDAKLKIYCHTTAGRGFTDGDGNLRKDLVYAIGSGPDVVAMFKNGDVLPC